MLLDAITTRWMIVDKCSQVDDGPVAKVGSCTKRS